MSTLANTWQRLVRRVASTDAPRPSTIMPRRVRAESASELASDDPLVAYLTTRSGATEVEQLPIDSPARAALQRTGMKLVVPLVSQGELMGLLSLGPRLSDQDYSRDDKRLLEGLASQAAPALRVAQLVRQQQAQARARAHMEQELQVARAIQQFFLPQAFPELDGWELGAHYQPARAVGGDFYDFVPLEQGQLGIVIGDVADKGVPAALVMAATRSILRASAQRLVEPAEVLSRVNDLVVLDTPPHIFVTCLYAVLDPSTGDLRYANAGHAPPFLRSAKGETLALQARGLPLGVMPGYEYQAHEVQLAPEDHLLFYSDGLVEAHSPRREMFGFDRLEQLLAEFTGASSLLIDTLLSDLSAFVGKDWEQEDDVTLVALKRLAESESSRNNSWETLAEFSIAREFGNERLAVEHVVDALAEIVLVGERLDALKTAVGEAIVNAIEHGDNARPDVPVSILVRASACTISISVRNASSPSLSTAEVPQPDLAAKVEGRQQPRGWGLYLMRRLADEVIVSKSEDQHTVELSFSR